MSKRKKIPKYVRDIVYDRQSNGCAICPNRFGIKHLHHVDAVYFNTENKNAVNNLVLLCEECHRKVHLADPDTCMRVYEYAYYIQTGTMPEDPYSLITAEEVVSMIRNS